MTELVRVFDTILAIKLPMDVLWNVLIISAVLLVLLFFAGLMYQAIGSARDAARYRPPGSLVDVGDHRLHIYCIGEGAPTVVFDSALGGSCLSWTLVQPDVAAFTRACSYDRAGFGWSDADPMPRTVERIVEELHSLLAKAGIKGPYVLVGHSFGGLTTRLYASKYPDEVGGMVLVDPADPQEWLQMTEQNKRRLERGAQLSRRGAIFARLGIARFVSFLVSAGALPIARFSVSLMSLGALKGDEDRILAPVNRLPLHVRPVLKTFWTQPKFFKALASQIAFVPQSAAQVAATGGYADKPLVVLSASNPSPDRARAQEALARLSTDGQHIVASNSGHWIPLDQPQVVVDAIHRVVESVRRKKSGRPNS